MFSTSTDSDLSKNSIKIQQEDKFFSRLLSRENSTRNPSLGVYYGGGAGAVPFMWESQPGTPKCKLRETSLPPLTPPPSYYAHTNCNKPIKKLQSRSNNLLQFLFLKLNGKKNYTVASSPSSSSLSSNSSCLSSSCSMMVPISTSPKKHLAGFLANGCRLILGQIKKKLNTISNRRIRFCVSENSDDVMDDDDR